MNKYVIGCLLAVICKTCNFLYHGCRKCLKDPSYSETVAVFLHHIEATASYVYMVVVEIESLIKILHPHCLMAFTDSSPAVNCAA